MVHVDSYKPSKKHEIIKQTSSGIIIEFNKIFDTDKEDLNNFVMKKKKAYIGQKDGSTLRLIANYINYFIEYYDEDNELILNYLNMKYRMDTTNKYKFKKFKKDVLETFLTPSFLEKVDRMVKDNYKTGILVKKNLSKEKKQLELNHKHIKILMKLSIIYKILSPILTHYIYVFNKKDMDRVLFEIEIEIFKYVKEDNIVIYNKLRKSIESCINQTNNDKILWSKSEKEGNDKDAVADILMKKLVTDGIIKYFFTKNPAIFNYVFLKKQLYLTINKKYNFEFKELTNTMNENDGLSGMDKLEIFMTKIDEGNIIRGKLNVKIVLKKLQKDFNIKISKKELNFYRKNLRISKLQRNIIFLFFGKYFGGPSEVFNVTRKQYYKLAIIFKKILISYRFNIFPYIVVGNIENRNVRKRKATKKQIEKLQGSEIYNRVVDNYKDIIDESDIIEFIMSIMNNRYLLVDYLLKEDVDDEINADEDVLLLEIVRFLNLI